MGKRTPLYACHAAAHAKLVDFAGWDMPLHYGSQIQEHHHVRQQAGLFDVSHMTVVDVAGTGAANYLRYLLANNIDRLVPGKALYTCMLNETGGVVDDLIVYRLDSNSYRLVVNSATREKDLAWLQQHAVDFNVQLHERTDLAILALQGPHVREIISALFSAEETARVLALKLFHAVTLHSYFIARTGYTGEDGFEIMLPAVEAVALWERAVAAGAMPCGLGARDTLRLEAGLNLYGADMDETVTPLESNLAWTVQFEPATRHFIGRTALEQQLQTGVQRVMVGLVLEGQGVLRNHQSVQVAGLADGEITSGSFSPTLNKGIALARVPAGIGSHCTVLMRGKPMVAHVIKPPFVRQGKKTFTTMMERENE